MNPAMSSFKEHHITHLDRLMNPWALETFEEQGLLAQTANVVFKKKGKTKESKSYGDAQHVAGEFACWYSDDEESDNGDTDYSDNEVPGSDYSDSSVSSTNSGDDEESSSSDSQPRTHRRSSSSDSKVHNAMPDSDSESDEDTVHGGTKFDPFEYIDRCAKRPLGRVKFKWTKVRTVSVAPQYDDAQKYTGRYVLICSCGFPVRIGVVCRHILAVLMFMLFNIKKKFGDSDYQLEEYDSEEEIDVDHSLIDWDNVPLIDLCNQDIVSKIKYYAALHNKGHLFKLSDRLFRPIMPENVAGVRKHPPKNRFEDNSSFRYRIFCAISPQSKRTFPEFLKMDCHMMMPRFMYKVTSNPRSQAQQPLNRRRVKSEMYRPLNSEPQASLAVFGTSRTDSIRVTEMKLEF
jgi:hypothetical protein